MLAEVCARLLVAPTRAQSPPYILHTSVTPLLQLVSRSPGQVELRLPGAGQLQVPVLPPGEPLHLLAAVPLLGPGASPRLVSKLVPAVSNRAVNEPSKSYTVL